MLSESLSWFGAVSFNAVPLDMSQCLFNGSRIPKKGVVYNDASQKHFVAMRKGRFYVVRLFADNGPLRCFPPSISHLWSGLPHQLLHHLLPRRSLPFPIPFPIMASLWWK
ncbi:hypothetical protein PRIPAC_89865 [Pristionchus pacificus]|uniref:Carn_acyltransf domain-containing protein n=1 Tax=Pristionchus pacificus TaxID=54126 RepID=A0A2A6CYX2_PRIPA|nr:hypothetical protein PRIPAC_89865 [Pristionchus pacificus]|eukprot:PDM83223.1 hypothetical protein PRIPAC_34855 [Pristionchus pacificus]